MAENTEKRSRTREKLKNALISLCEEKAFYDITILEICQRAGVYRSTFYRYYDTKDEVLREIEREYIEDTRSLTPTLWTLHPGATDEDLARYRRELTADMEYHRAHRQLCRFLLSPAGDIFFYNQMLESISAHVRRNYQHYGRAQGRNPAYLIRFIAAGFISAVHEWLKKDDCSPREIADTLLTMMMKLQ